jgi:hypothetical protein
MCPCCSTAIDMAKVYSSSAIHHVLNPMLLYVHVKRPTHTPMPREERRHPNHVQAQIPMILSDIDCRLFFPSAERLLIRLIANI